MAGKNTAVFGIYTSQSAVETAVAALEQAGFRSTDISALLPENEGTKDFAHEKGTKAPEGASTGAGTGAAIGGVLGWLTGIGALAIPGLGPFIAAGPIMAALAGVGVGGAVGGLTGALIGMGIPEYEAKRYEGRVKNGGILLSVHSDNSDWTDKAKRILEQTGAQDIASASEKSGDIQNADKPMLRSGSLTDTARADGIRETERSPEREQVIARGEGVDTIIIDTDRTRFPKVD
ncbi:MAG TPA: quinol:electron acceptor oxidoreductase subunit ActD [Gemmatimonadaceae bacterium]|nr:quinol:electron acceptor oxidoreductase subunit ActD [Gemmatimonadaceae bacterium]